MSENLSLILLMSWVTMASGTVNELKMDVCEVKVELYAVNSWLIAVGKLFRPSHGFEVPTAPFNN